MEVLKFYVVDVFASHKYGGNQLAVFIDLEDKVSESQMQTIAREINFAETTFIKQNVENRRFVVRIFTPEHEVPFAGHPSIGTSYVIAKFLLPSVPDSLTLALAHGDIEITILDAEHIDSSTLFMRQVQPEFRELFTHDEVSSELHIALDDMNLTLPIQEVSTGLPYIIIPLKTLNAIENLRFDYATLQRFLASRHKYRSNSPTGHSTSLFFFTEQTYEADNQYNTRMLLLENGRLSEDAATGSANGCFLAYLLKHRQPEIEATIEQGFQINRKSYLYLKGSLHDEQYHINVGGRTQLVAEGTWYV